MARRQLAGHANRYDGLTWCDARTGWSHDDDGLTVIGEMGPPESLEQVSCEDCLRRIAAYGELAARQLMKRV